ncbi:MAG: DHH family phosphoesterase [Pirellulales bacterium]
MPIDWPRFNEIVAGANRFVLTSHVRPDCDALGSELAMAGVLEALGKHVRIVNGQETPPNLAFIDPRGRIKALGADISAEELARDLTAADVVMVLDTSAWQQLGPMADVLRSTAAKKIVVDHHVSGDDLGAELFKDTSAEATGHLVVQAADALGVPLTADIARAAFAAIATDTGWFRFNSTTAATMSVAARLIEAGANPQAIYTDLYEQDTLERVQLRGRILARVKTELDGRLVHTAALAEDFAATGALPTDTEDVINLTLGIAGTEVAVIFVAVDGGKGGDAFKLSFRSRSHVDCSKLAEKFGGGGHKAAAGASIDGPIEQAQQLVLDAVRAAMR